MTYNVEKETKKMRNIKKILIIAILLFSTLNFATAQQQDTFDEPGQYTWTVPQGVEEITIKTWGAEGGIGRQDGDWNSGQPGIGGYTEAVFEVEEGEELEIFVGGRGEDGDSEDDIAEGGFNGGGDSEDDGDSGAGGGKSDVRLTENLEDALIVAGGGAGASTIDEDFGTTALGNSGSGGPNQGEDGEDANAEETFADGGTGGTQTEGGTGGTGDTEDGEDGAFGQGGSGISSGAPTASGGAGGGWYGGGSGGGGQTVAQGSNYAAVGGSGGGSNFVDEETNRLIQVNENQRATTAENDGDGKVILEYEEEEEEEDTTEEFNETIHIKPQINEEKQSLSKNIETITQTLTEKLTANEKTLSVEKTEQSFKTVQTSQKQIQIDILESSHVFSGFGTEEKRILEKIFSSHPLINNIDSTSFEPSVKTIVAPQLQIEDSIQLKLPGFFSIKIEKTSQIEQESTFSVQGQLGYNIDDKTTSNLLISEKLFELSSLQTNSQEKVQSLVENSENLVIGNTLGSNIALNSIIVEEVVLNALISEEEPIVLAASIDSEEVVEIKSNELEKVNFKDLLAQDFGLVIFESTETGIRDVSLEEITINSEEDLEIVLEELKEGQIAIILSNDLKQLPEELTELEISSTSRTELRTNTLEETQQGLIIDQSSESLIQVFEQAQTSPPISLVPDKSIVTLENLETAFKLSLSEDNIHKSSINEEIEPEVSQSSESIAIASEKFKENIVFDQQIEEVFKTAKKQDIGFILDSRSQKQVFIDATANQQYRVIPGMEEKTALIDISEIRALFSQDENSIAILEHQDEQIIFARTQKIEETELKEHKRIETSIKGEKSLSTVFTSDNIIKSIIDTYIAELNAPRQVETAELSISILEATEEELQTEIETEENILLIQDEEKTSLLFSNPEFSVITDIEQQNTFATQTTKFLLPETSQTIISNLQTGQLTRITGLWDLAATSSTETGEKIIDSISISSDKTKIVTRTEHLTEHPALYTEETSKIIVQRFNEQNIVLETENNSILTIFQLIEQLFAIMPFLNLVEVLEPEEETTTTPGEYNIIDLYTDESEEEFEEEFYLITENIEISVEPGESFSKQIEFIANKENRTELTTSIKGDKIKKFLEIEQKRINITKGDYRININGKIEENIEPMEIASSIQLYSDKTREIPIELTIKEIKEEIEIKESESEIPGEYRLQLSNLEELVGKQVEIQKNIYDNNNNLVHSKTETLVVGSETSNIQLITETENLKTGEYQIELITSFDDQKHIENSTFVVEETEKSIIEEEKEHITTWTIIILFSLLILAKIKSNKSITENILEKVVEGYSKQDKTSEKDTKDQIEYIKLKNRSNIHRVPEKPD